MKKAKNVLLNVALVGCIAVLGVTGTLIYKHYHQVNKSKETVEELKDTPTATEDSEKNFIPTKEFYQEMKAKYPDYQGWLLWDDEIISEPVVKGVDNDQYLRTNMDGEYDIMGTVFIDAQDDINDPNVMMYGHSIPGDFNTHAKFNALQMMTDSSYYKAHKHFKFYLEDTIDTYEVFSAFEYAYDRSTPYQYSQNTFNDESDFKEWIRQSINHSAVGFRDIDQTTVNDKYITMQTCADNNNYQKYIVVAIRTSSEPY